MEWISHNFYAITVFYAPVHTQSFLQIDPVSEQICEHIKTNHYTRSLQYGRKARWLKLLRLYIESSRLNDWDLCDGVPVFAWTATALPRRPPHPRLWCCSSSSSATICQPELSHCASLSTQHIWGYPVFVYASPTVWNWLPDELRNSDSFDSFKRFLKTPLFSRY